VFIVTGSAPNGADSDNRSPQGGLGPLGSGTALPWEGSMTYHSSALYYDVTAQLQGGGDITCKVRVRVTQFYSEERTSAKRRQSPVATPRVATTSVTHKPKTSRAAEGQGKEGLQATPMLWPT
jgi:hypothetical protein